MKDGLSVFRRALADMGYERPDYSGLRVVWSRTKKTKGVATGHTKTCMLDGCGGIRIQVLWPNGKKTWPCAAGMTFTPRGRSARIGFPGEWKEQVNGG